MSLGELSRHSWLGMIHFDSHRHMVLFPVRRLLVPNQVEDAATDVYLGPSTESHRSVVLDTMRGFALLGILFVNFQGQVGEVWPTADYLARQAIGALARDSFYPIYAFLFGVGFFHQIQRIDPSGRSSERLYLRRLGALFVIGSVHAVGFWTGDVLVNYSILGIALLLVHRMPVSLQLAAACALIAVSASGRDAVHPLALSELSAFDGRPRIDSYLEGLKWRWTVYSEEVWGYTQVSRWIQSSSLGLFILGAVGARMHGLMTNAGRRLTTWTVLVVGIAAGVGGHLALMSRLVEAPSVPFTAAWTAANYGLAATYGAGIACIIGERAGVHRWLGPLASAGRLSLTNYLTQSVVLVTAYTPLGIGLNDPGAAFKALVCAAFFFGIQIPLSQWWLARFPMGPVEWLWRRASYGHLATNRRGA